MQTMCVRSAACVAALAGLATAAFAAPSTGYLKITQNDTGNTAASVSGSLATFSSGSYAGGTRGDFQLRFESSEAQDVTNGVLMVSIAQNGRDNSGSLPTAIGAGPGYATAGIQVGPNTGTANRGIGSALTLSNANITGVGSGGEWNANQSYGYFRYSEFLGGWVSNGTHDDANTAGVNNGEMTEFASSSAGFTVGSGASDPGTFTVFDDTATTGQYTLRMSSITAPTTSTLATSQNGILLVTGGKNEDNYALSRANSDGSFTMICKDNGTNGSSFENDPVAFTYIPLNHPDMLAVGRIDAEGDTIVGSGLYTITKGGTGEWFLTAPGANDMNSVLLISAEGGAGNNVDNIVSFEWDGANSRWVIQSRDLPGSATAAPGLQNMQANEASFSFALMPIPTPGSAALLGLGGLMFARRRR